MRVMFEIFEGTTRTTAMIMLIIVASYFLNFALASVGFADVVSDFLNHLGLGAYGTLLVIIALYFVLGMFVETLSLMVITIRSEERRVGKEGVSTCRSGGSPDL